MDYKTTGNTIILRLNRGEEVMASIMEVCKKEGVKAGSISGLGAVDHAVVGILDIDKKEYFPNTFDECMEITALIGNVSTMEGETYLHIHATFGKHDGNAVGGHLNEAKISATAEIFIQVLDTTIERKMDDEIGINLMVL